MSISPFSVRPGTPGQESRRARLVVLLVVLGIAAALLAYAISPSVRHAVGHAAHSVSRLVDKDQNEHPKATTHAPARVTTTHSGGTPAPTGG